MSQEQQNPYKEAMTPEQQQMVNFISSEVDAFMRATPGYFPCEENLQRIVEKLESWRMGQCITRTTLACAYAQLLLEDRLVISEELKQAAADIVRSAIIQNFLDGKLAISKRIQ